jgi:chaperonin GroES
MVKTKITPLFDNILIRPLEAETKTSSGIILPDSVKEKPQMGEIVAVGAGKVTPKGEKEKIVVKVGQKVMYKKWGGNEIKINGEELMLVEQKDILAVIDGKI